tara:strand:+ start:172 stop:357 length:186 start_codon:yes stop_codon:yes gene_type:complete
VFISFGIEPLGYKYSIPFSIYAAFFHSLKVGSLPLLYSQKAFASKKLTCATGSNSDLGIFP